MNLSFVHSHGSSRIYDIQISRRILNGEKELFELLIRPYSPAMQKTLGVLWRRRESVDDITLRTYAQAAVNLYQFYGQVSFRTWMIAIALRESKKSAGWGEAIDTLDCLPGRENGLTDEQKLIALLYKITGLGEREIAYCLGALSGTIAQDIKLIRDLIRARMLSVPDYDQPPESSNSLIKTFMQTYLNKPAEEKTGAVPAAYVLEPERAPIPRMRAEHLSNLALCSRIRRGFIKGIEMNRIKTYADWYWTHHLLTHFNSEEKIIFPILGSQHALVRKALREHRRLKRHFESREDIHRMLNRIEEELEAHVRFEETVLFKEVEKAADSQALRNIEVLHQGGGPDEPSWQDRFWE